jgi:ferredoxin-NADP reductase
LSALIMPDRWRATVSVRTPASRIHCRLVRLVPGAEEARILLFAGGSGIVPLMAMLRQRILTGSAEFRLVYSVGSPGDYVFVDASGAAVIPAGDVRAVLHTANQVVAADAESVVTIRDESPNTLGDSEY